jgi:hypothetical protein
VSNRRSKSLCGHTGNNFTPEPPKKFTALEINISGHNGSELLSSSFYGSQTCPGGKNLLHSNTVLLVASCNKEESFRQKLF